MKLGKSTFDILALRLVAKNRVAYYFIRSQTHNHASNNNNNSEKDNNAYIDIEKTIDYWHKYYNYVKSNIDYRIYTINGGYCNVDKMDIKCR